MAFEKIWHGMSWAIVTDFIKEDQEYNVLSDST